MYFIYVSVTIKLEGWLAAGSDSTFTIQVYRRRDTARDSDRRVLLKDTKIIMGDPVTYQTVELRGLFVMSGGDEVFVQVSNSSLIYISPVLNYFGMYTIL